VHYFQLNIGDLLKRAGHLAPLKLGVLMYLELWYRSQERPIPDETALEAGRAPEPVVRAVLEEFFQRRAAGWWNGSIEADIKRVSQKSVNCSNAGKLGGRPKKNRSLSDGKPNAKPPHNPIPQEELSVSEKERASDTVGEIADFALGSTAEQKAERKRKPCPFDRIIAMYHEALPALPRFEVRTAARDAQIRQRYVNDLPTEAHWRNFFSHVSASDFLMGRAPAAPGRKVFRADLEWLTKQANFAKIKEQKYHG
jgi:uncharacterized protein YdaU (DUF1376 family)